jgi:hypothetical protein
LDCCGETLFLTWKDKEWYQKLIDNTSSIEEKS